MLSDQAAATHFPPKRVLVVDDNESSALTLTWAMEMFGYDVRTCYDGLSAVRVAHDFHPEVVLLDIGMPAMDGLEVCRRLRADPELSGATVVAQTGWGDRDMRRQTSAAGFDHHLTKPIDLPALLTLLNPAHALPQPKNI